MPKCPTCKDGKIQIITHNLCDDGLLGPKGTSTSEITCIDCNGTQEVSEETLYRIKFEKEMWCQCEDSMDTVFYNDGEHSEIYKHHYRCSICDGVVQIG